MLLKHPGGAVMKQTTLLFTILMLVPFSAIGQKSVPLKDFLNQRIEKNDHLSNTSFDLPGDPQNVQLGALLEQLKLGGFFQAWYIASDEQIDQFKIRRAELSLNGDLTDEASFKIMFDLAKDTQQLQDLILTLKLLGHKFSMGQFKRPLSLEGSQTSASKLEVMERADSVRAYGNQRDRGAKVEGKFDPAKLSYIVAIFNGEGKNKDTNDQQDLAGMLIFQPIDQLGFYAATYDGSKGVDADAQRRNIVGIKFEQGPLHIRGEYLEGKDANIEGQGWYVLGAYDLSDLDIEMLENLSLAARYEEWNKDLEDNSEIEVYTIGVQYFLDPKEYNKLSIDYILIDGKGTEKDSHGMTFGFQGKF